MSTANVADRSSSAAAAVVLYHSPLSLNRQLQLNTSSMLLQSVGKSEEGRRHMPTQSDRAEQRQCWTCCSCSCWSSLSLSLSVLSSSVALSQSVGRGEEVSAAAASASVTTTAAPHLQSHFCFLRHTTLFHLFLLQPLPLCNCNRVWRLSCPSSSSSSSSSCLLVLWLLSPLRRRLRRRRWSSVRRRCRRVSMVCAECLAGRCSVLLPPPPPQWSR